MTRFADDKAWQRIEDAQRPSPQLLQRTELELQELEQAGAPPLSAEHVARLLARTRPRTADKVRPGPAALHGPLRRAATGLLLVAAAATYGHRFVWPTTPSPMLTLAFGQAVADVTEHGAPEDRWRDGIGFLDGQCADGLQLLVALQQSGATAVRDAARAACRRLVDEARGPVTGDDATLQHAAAVARDASAPDDARVAAVLRVEELVGAGVDALRAARDDSPSQRRLKHAYVDRFEAELRDLRAALAAPDGAATSPSSRTGRRGA